jgi:Ulp1 family protease
MFPVLEAMGNNGSDTAGHYYLLVLNLRAKRFEVMDSMRSLGDERLRTSCNTIMEGIKTLWRKHYPNSKKDIEDYEPVDIGVPKQSNK